MKLFARRPSPAMAMSMAAMAVAIGGTAIVAQAGGGGSDTGKIVGYAYVNDSGDVTSSLSLNVRNSNVGVESDVFCFKNLPFRFKGLQAAIDYRDSSSANSTAQVVKGDYDCSGTAEAEVQTVTSEGAPEAEPVFVQFYK